MAFMIFGIKSNKEVRMSTQAERVAALKADAAKVMEDLGTLTKTLADLGKGKADDLSAETIAGMEKQLRAIQDRATTVVGEGRKSLQDLDQSVRANPYIYILGALGLGMLLGKARRP